MMVTYQTSEVAQIMGIHPNTVRLYEKWQLIPPAGRLANGYRVFTKRHIAHCRLVRLAFQIEILQGGLRQKIVQMLKTAASGDFATAITLTQEYLAQIAKEQAQANEAIAIVQAIASGKLPEDNLGLKRQEVAKVLDISIDTLRSWERNNLLSVKRKANGYRVYTAEDIRRLKIIRTLRSAHYSLEAILHLLNQLAQDNQADIGAALTLVEQEEDIISVCDRLLISLSAACRNGHSLLAMLEDMKAQFS